MFENLLAKIFGTKNNRILKEYQEVVEQINSFEQGLQQISDQALSEKTDKFKQRVEAGESLDSILPEAYAVVREAARRTMGMRHYDVQMMGGIALHRGAVAEMKTGEGKTLSATLPLYLNSLGKHSSHLITVNDYLAKRDALWMKPIYDFLKLKVGYLQNDQDDAEKKDAYASDIVYGTNNEFGFDYLRDNMKFNLSDYVQGKLNFAIVDEVDSILIDEARTPLIISGPSQKDVKLYDLANQAAKKLNLKDKDYEVDEKAKNVIMTETGVDRVESFLGVENLYSPENVLLLHHVQQALKAKTLFKRDVDYIISPDNEVLIVDEFTGRVLSGRRYSDGLHQALEAKEGVPVERENQTLASITLQNYFRMYKKLAGMTGTASTDALEFHKIYNLQVISIPTHKPMIRDDQDDVIFLNKDDKYNAVIKDIKECFEKGQPVLVGTASVESSEHVSHLLNNIGLPHNVLNAKNHAREADIIKEAGQKGKVTISTSMAGRGTDIKLGENIDKIGGLRVIATERYENRRVDDQLRGRSGRQGDPGSSKFFISLEDDLMRIFGGDRTKNIMEKYAGMEPGESIEHHLVSRLVKSNQEKLEMHHFDTRKHLLEYDDVMNQQRNVIYDYRKAILSGSEELSDFIKSMIGDVVNFVFDAHAPRAYCSPEQFEQIVHQISLLTNLEKDDFIQSDCPVSDSETASACISKILKIKYQQYRSEFPEEIIKEAEYWTILGIVDYAWKIHLQNIDHLKEGIGLRGYGQKNPLYEYKKEAYEEFCQMIKQVKWDIVKRIFKMKPDEVSKKLITEIENQKQKELEQINQAVKKSKNHDDENSSNKGKKKKKAGGGFFGH